MRRLFPRVLAVLVTSSALIVVVEYGLSASAGILVGIVAGYVAYSYWQMGEE